MSGDYYDFLKLDEHRVGLVLGDVSGKGISAALLMAAIQSALRAQFYDGLAGGAGLHPHPVFNCPGRRSIESPDLRQHAAGKICDIFLRGLRRPNAQSFLHQRRPPGRPSFSGTARLSASAPGGRWWDCFLPSTYEVGEIRLEPNDLLLAYTDGITEPENTYGEEFGESRLLEVTRRMLNASPEVLVTRDLPERGRMDGQPGTSG